MRIFKIIAPSLLVLVCSCQRQAVPEKPELVEHTIYASLPSDGQPGTRTVLDPANDKKILWSSGESISVLCEGGNYKFDGDNTQECASASFTGNGPAELGSYIALYPYNGSARVDGDYVYTSLPASQTGKAGSFADGYLITADDATGNNVSFNHLCSGLRFQVGRDDISAVSIRGNKGEKIAGDFRFSFTAADTPAAQEGTEEIVTLNAPGGHFETGKYYYIVILPTTFQAGFTLAANAGRQVGELRFDSAVTFSCGAFKNITGLLDERMDWPSATSQVYYGPQNSFCIRPGQTITFDIQPRKITASWQRSGILAPGNPVPATGDAHVLWGSSVASAVVTGDNITITASNTSGSSLVAVKNGNRILWSYLIWVTPSAPAETILPSGAVMQEELGGVTLSFQWGRKDPLQAGATTVSNQGDDGLAYSIAHPDEYIQGIAPTNNWYTGSTDHADNDLWGGVSGVKTVWDPCPQGWRIPADADFADLIELDTAFGFREGYYYSSLPLKTGDVNNKASCLSVAYYPSGNYYEYELTGDNRNAANYVRCVKE